MSALAGRSRISLALYGGVLLLAIVVGAVLAYSERFGGDNGPYILLGVLLVIAIAVAILLQWRLGALLLVAALPFESLIVVGPVTSGMKALAALTFVSLALALLMDQKLFERFARLWQQPLALAALAFVLWISVSILWASDKGDTLRTVLQFSGLLGLMVFIGLLEGRYLLLAWAGFVFSAALSVPAAYILPMPAGSDMAVSGRLSVGLGPNSYSCLLAIALFGGYFGLLRRHRMTAYLLAPIFVYGIFASASRTGLIALVATPLLALFVPRLAARLDWRRTLPMYVVGVAAIVVIVLAVPSVADIVLKRDAGLSQPGSANTWSGRWSIWQGALHVIASHPILGVGAGYGNYSQATMQYSAQGFKHSLDKGEVAGVAHNMFLSVATQLGLVGLILFLIILFFLFKTALPIAQRPGLGTGIFLGLIVAMFAGMSLTWEHEKIVYVLFGSVLALQLNLDSARRAPSPAEREGSADKGVALTSRPGQRRGRANGGELDANLGPGTS